MKFKGHVELMEVITNSYKILDGIPRRNRRYGDIGLSGRITLKLFLQLKGMICWIGYWM
jgi:hypothetical protein